jgi:hypothetical protein
MQLELTTEQRAILLSLVWREESNVMDTNQARWAELHKIEDLLTGKEQ